MSHNEWYKYAYVDYFSSFLKLWIAFNSWYEQNYIKEEIQQTKLKEGYSALKSEIIKPFDILIGEGVIEEVDNKIVLKDLNIQRKDDFIKLFQNLIEEKALDFWSTLVLDRLGDKEYVKKVGDDYNHLLILLDDIEFSKNIYDLSKKIDNLYETDKRISFDSNQEIEIITFISSILKDSEKEFLCESVDEIGSIDISMFDNKQAIKMYQIFESKKDSLDNSIPLNEQIGEIVEINKTIENGDNILFLDGFEFKNILLIIYIIRNKLVHGELTPSNDKHYEIIKIAFYIMDSIFRELTRE